MRNAAIKLARMGTFTTFEELRNFLPADLRQSAVPLGKEFAWCTTDILALVDYLVARKWAVHGFDLVDDVHGMPRWILSSNYSGDNDAGW